MSSLLEGARRTLNRRSDLDDRLAGLEQAVAAARGRLDDVDLDHAAQVVTRASGRLRLSADHTIVALAGATGSGKSSTFNALAGLDLAAVGVRRPTTSWATACTWGERGATDLLEWLGIPLRHQVVRDSMLDTRGEGNDLAGLVLLDLPDHDSTEVAHHLEVDRLIELADLMIWVLDPQKYADAAIHDRFLRPLAEHREVMLVVLNHIDEVAPERRESLLVDVRRLLADDDLATVPVLPISARTGQGLDDLQRAVAARIAGKAGTRARVATDIDTAARALLEVSGDAGAPEIDSAAREHVAAEVASAAGIPAMTEAMSAVARRRALRATGWPITSWMRRSDPVDALELDAEQREALRSVRAGRHQAPEVQTAQVDARLRDIGDGFAADLGRPWQRAVRGAATARSHDLAERLDQALASDEVGLGRLPAWCGAMRVVQWLLLLVAVAGAAWLAVIALTGVRSSASAVTAPTVGGVNLPGLLFAGGAALGLVLALVCRGLVGVSVRRRADRAEQRMREVVGSVTDELVVAPVAAELAAYSRTREGLHAALD